MRRLLCAGLMFLSFAGAQAGGPVYSRFGIGDLLWFGSSRAMGMGGLGYALRGQGFVNIINPAGLSGLKFTRFSGSFNYSQYTSEGAGLTGSYWRSGLQNVALAIPVDTSLGIVMSLETAPYSLVGYKSVRTIDQSGVVTTQSFTGSGGLSRISIGGSVNLLKSLSFGAKASVLYGRTQQFVVIDFANERFTDDQQDRSVYYSSPLFEIGSVFDVGRTSFLPGTLTLGFTLSLPAAPSTESFSAYRALDTVIVSQGSSEIPLRVGIGASLVMSERYTVIADFAFQDWSSIGTTSPASLQSALRMSAGFEVMPVRDDQDFFERIGYRIGLGYEQTYVSVNGKSIDDMFGTVGFSLPIGPGRMDISAQGGIRGTSSTGLQKDTYVNLNIGLTSAEVWFMEILED